MGLKRAKVSPSKLKDAMDADDRAPSAIAEAAGISHSHLHYLLTRGLYPAAVKVATVRRLARVLGCNVEDLLASRAEIKESAKFALLERLGINFIRSTLPLPEWRSPKDPRLKFFALLPTDWKNEGGLWFVSRLFTLAKWRHAFSPAGARVSRPSEEESLAFARALATVLSLVTAAQEVREDALVYLSAMLTPSREGARADVEGVWSVWEKEEKNSQTKEG